MESQKFSLKTFFFNDGDDDDHKVRRKIDNRFDDTSWVTI